MTRLGHRERHLLLSIVLLDDASNGVKSDAIVAAVNDALAKRRAAAAADNEKGRKGASGSSANEKKKTTRKQPPPPPPPLQVRHYSAHSGLCLMRSAFAESAEVRAVAPEIRFVNMRPVRMEVTRAFGSATCARRKLAQHLEELAWAAAQRGDQRAAKEMGMLCSQLAELQKR